LAGDNPVLDTTEAENDIVLKREAEERKLHRMAKVHNFLEMWQGSQNLRATQRESRAQNKQMTAIGYISDTEEIVNTSWTNIQHDGSAAFKLSERSPQPPAFSANDLLGGRTQLLNVRRMKKIDHHLVESDKDSAPESISDTENWLHWNRVLENPNVSEDACEADDESDLEQENIIKDSETTAQRDVSAAQNVPGLIRPIRKSKTQAEKAIGTASAMETQKNKGNKKM
jgi:hypothetical protein